MQKLLASWNPERDVWEGGQMDLFSGLSDVYSETWPASGMTRNGQAFELPTSARATGDTVSSLLPTPRATRGGSSTETERLMPTPRASDTNGSGAHGDGGMDLRTAVSRL